MSWNNNDGGNWGRGNGGWGGNGGGRRNYGGGGWNRGGGNRQYNNNRGRQREFTTQIHIVCGLYPPRFNQSGKQIGRAVVPAEKLIQAIQAALAETKDSSGRVQIWVQNTNGQCPMALYVAGMENDSGNNNQGNPQGGSGYSGRGYPPNQNYQNPGGDRVPPPSAAGQSGTTQPPQPQGYTPPTAPANPNPVSFGQGPTQGQAQQEDDGWG